MTGGANNAAGDPKGDPHHLTLPHLPANKKPQEPKSTEGITESRSGSGIHVPTLPLENGNKEHSSRSHRSRGSSPRAGPNNGAHSARGVNIGISGAGKKSGRTSFDGLPNNPNAHHSSINNSQSGFIHRAPSADVTEHDNKLLI